MFTLFSFFSNLNCVTFQEKTVKVYECKNTYGELMNLVRLGGRRITEAVCIDVNMTQNSNLFNQPIELYTRSEVES